MKKIYLYVKQSPYGLKYLGKTTLDPYKYKGSGKIWKRHINKHNLTRDDITTEILFESYSNDEIREMGILYSKKFNVVESSEWANLIEESGTGGDTSRFIDYSSIDFRIDKILANTNYIATRTNKQMNTPEARIKAVKTRREKDGYDVSSMRSVIEQVKIECKYCGKMIDLANSSRWHQEKCKHKPINKIDE